MSFYSHTININFTSSPWHNCCHFRMYGVPYFSMPFSSYLPTFPSFYNFIFQPMMNNQMFFPQWNFNTQYQSFNNNSPQTQNTNYSSTTQNTSLNPTSLDNGWAELMRNETWNVNNSFTSTMPSFNNTFQTTFTTPITNTGTTSTSTSTSTSKSKTTSKTSTTTSSTYYSSRIDTSYSKLSRDIALQKAKSDNRLEELKGGRKWSLAGTFETDIPFAKKGTARILDIVASQIGEDLVITSALGTKGISGKSTPHAIGGYTSHHNAENPKLDIDVKNREDGERLKKKLLATGYFSHIVNEGDHLDVQIDPKKYQSLSITA